MGLITIRLLLADAALPLVWFTMPAVILMLVPTVLLEGLLLKFLLRLPSWRAFKVSLLANIASTIAGVPLATLLAYGATAAVSPWTRQVIEKEHWQSPLGDIVMAIINSTYISAYVGEARWLLPAALLIIFIPAFLISWFLENWIARALLLKRGERSVVKEVDTGCTSRSIKRAVGYGNVASYFLLFIFTAVMLIRSQFPGLFW